MGVCDRCPAPQPIPYLDHRVKAGVAPMFFKRQTWQPSPQQQQGWQQSESPQQLQETHAAADYDLIDRAKMGSYSLGWEHSEALGFMLGYHL